MLKSAFLHCLCYNKINDLQKREESGRVFPSFSPLGDRAIRITFGDKLTDKTNDLVTEAFQRIVAMNLLYITEMVQGYVTLTVYYVPWKAPSYETIINELKLSLKQLERTSRNQPSKRRHITLPVYYGGEHGPDLISVADYHQISKQELIQRHTSSIYRVYMIGFAPGFPYLGGLDKSIATPRRRTPRKHVLAGSVGIAGPQTGVYSIDSPGGWQIIGHTPISLFDPKKQEPILLNSGDLVSFQSVSKQDYDKISQGYERGIYHPEIAWKDDRGGNL